MIVLFWSKATRDLLRSFGWGICRFRKIVRRFEATPIAPFCKSSVAGSATSVNGVLFAPMLPRRKLTPVSEFSYDDGTQLEKIAYLRVFRVTDMSNVALPGGSIGGAAGPVAGGDDGVASPRRRNKQLFVRARSGVVCVSNDDRLDDLRLYRPADHRLDVPVSEKRLDAHRPSADRWVADCRPEHLLRACADSLRRLRLESIELYQLHAVDHRIPIEDSIVAGADVHVLGVREDERVVGGFELFEGGLELLV
jgi:hypothetical protein